MKTMKQLFIAIAVLFGISCSKNAKLPVLPAGFDYTITEDKLDKGLDRRTVRVRVNQEVNEAVIKDLSQWIKDTRTDVSNMIIFYYIENGMYVGNSWVRVDFNPEYKHELIAVPVL